MALVKVQELKTGNWKYVEIDDKQLDSLNKINEEFVDYNQLQSFIDRLEIKPEIKVLLESLRNFSIKIGNIILNIGRKILELIIYIYHNFPNALIGTIIGFTIGMIISSIPILGWALSWLITPLSTALGTWYGLKSDLQNKALKTEIITIISDIFGPLQGVKIDEPK